MLQSSNCSSVEHSNSLGNLPRGKLRILNIVASLDPVRVFSHEIFRDYKLEKLTRRIRMFSKRLQTLLPIGLSSTPPAISSEHRLLSVVNKERPTSAALFFLF